MSTMRYFVILLAFILIPAAYAASTSEWHYSGDSFKLGGVLYSVEGTDYNSVILGVGDNLYILSLGECVDKDLSRYCYIKSAYSPYDKDHIKFAGGNRFFGYYISIQDNTPKITITRLLTPSIPKFGEKADVEVTIENTGEYTVNYLSYSELMPNGLVSASTNPITYNTKTLNIGDIQKFTYSFTPINYSSMTLSPVVTFMYADKLYNSTVSPLIFSVDQPFTIVKNVTSTLNLGDVGVYFLNITNKDVSYPMVGTITITIPKELYVNENNGFNVQNITYTADLDLAPKEGTIIGVKYGTSYSNIYKIKANMSVTINQVVFTKYFEDSINARSDKLVPTVKLSSVRTKFKPGEEITVIGYLKNVNQKTSFANVKGVLLAPGIFNDTKFSHETFYPNKNITEAEVVAIMPQVDNATTFNITLKGTYVSPSNELLSFEDKKTIIVEPAKEYVKLTRIITPTPAVAGSNVTITVHVKNVFNEYLSFTAHEQYDPDLKFIGGIKFVDVSLKRDEEKDLYIYQLDIPKNASYNYSITTSLKIKDEDYPVKFTTDLFVSNVTMPNTTSIATNATINTTKLTKNGSQGSSNSTAAQESSENKGFFAKIWDDIKRWFSS